MAQRKRRSLFEDDFPGTKDIDPLPFDYADFKLQGASESPQPLPPHDPFGDLGGSAGASSPLSPIPPYNPFGDNVAAGGAAPRANEAPPVTGGGPSIAQIIGLAMEGFASGAQGRAPQGPALMQRGQQIAMQQRQQQREHEAEDAIANFDFEKMIKDPAGGLFEFAKIVAKKDGKAAASIIMSGQKILGDNRTSTLFQTTLQRVLTEAKTPTDVGRMALESGNLEIVKMADEMTKAMFPDAAAGEMTTDKLLVQAAQKMHPDDPVAQAHEVQNLKRQPRGAESRILDHFIEVNKGDVGKAIPAFKEFLTDKSASRAIGTETGRLTVRGTPSYQQTESDIAQVKQEGQETATRQAPLGQKAATWLNPDTLEAATPEMSQADATQKGFRPLPGGNAPQFIAASRAVRGLLTEWEDLIKILPKSTGNAAADKAMTYAHGAWLWTQDKDPEVAKFKALMKSQLPMVARSAGEVGNLAILEQELQAKSMPDFFHTQESAKAILEQKGKIVELTIRSALGVPSTGKTNKLLGDDEILEIRPKPKRR